MWASQRQVQMTYAQHMRCNPSQQCSWSGAYGAGGKTGGGRSADPHSPPRGRGGVYRGENPFWNCFQCALHLSNPPCQSPNRTLPACTPFLEHALFHSQIAGRVGGWVAGWLGLQVCEGCCNMMCFILLRSELVIG